MAILFSFFVIFANFCYFFVSFLIVLFCWFKKQGDPFILLICNLKS